MNIPGQITAGDSVKWRDDAVRDENGFALSAPLWALNYAIRGAAALDLASTPDGTGFLTSATTAQTAPLAAGTYYWTAFATSGDGERVTVARGTLEVLPDLTQATAGYDGRLQVEKDLAAIDAAIAARIAGGAVAEYSIAGRSLKNEPLPALYAMRDKVAAKVARARKPRQIFVSF
jgi:hypothetical protein